MHGVKRESEMLFKDHRRQNYCPQKRGWEKTPDEAGPERQEGHLGVSKTRNNGGPGKRRKREGYRKRCSWLGLTAAVRSHFVK